MKNYLNTTLRNVFWFKKVNDSMELEMKPPFQRNPVWVTKQKSYFIDSLLNGFPVPEIYMQEEIHGISDVKYILVDGQQRIRSVLEYLEGEYKTDNGPTSWGGKYYEDLDDQDKRTLLEYNFVVRILPSMDDDEIRTIFQRLNRNVISLNKQELRQATYWGPFIQLMNKISDDPIWTKIDIFTQNDIRRMNDVEYVSELTVAYLHGLQNKKQSLDKYYLMYEEEFEKAQVENIFNLVFSQLLDIVPGINETRWSKKTDFYTLFLLLAKYEDMLPLDESRVYRVRDLLLSFGRTVDERMKSAGLQEREATDDESNEVEIDQIEYADADSISKYMSGIRASSDLGSRRRREEALEKEFLAVLR
ncbi:DUF262 domain-containing protein [Paenibacillus sp. P25]|nr:DUF262 domain-containing protein [Paenibacillus sp. P25]